MILVGSGSAIYVDFTQKSANFKILIDGQSAVNDVDGLENCTPNGPISLSTAGEIQILVDGMLSKGSQGSADSDWFFEFNNFMYALAFFSFGHPTDLNLASPRNRRR